MYTKVFLLCLIKAWEKKFLKRDGEIGKHKLNETGTLNMKQKKWNKPDKIKRSSYGPAVSKHGCSLETSGALEKKKKHWVFVFFKKILK